MTEASWVERITSLSRWALSGSRVAAAERGTNSFLLMCASCYQIMWPSAKCHGSLGLLPNDQVPTVRLPVTIIV